jgi:hypothetical protein
MMRKILRTSVLVLTLCAPAFAGDIPMPPLPEPPPTHTVTEEPEAGGDVLNAQADSLTETVLGVIESVIALF